MRHPLRLDSANGKTLMPLPYFNLYLTTWRESEIVLHGIVVGAAILDWFATGVFLDVDDLEVDAFLFGIVNVISLTGNDSRGLNDGHGLRCGLVGERDCCSRAMLLVVCAGLLVLALVALDCWCVDRSCLRGYGSVVGCWCYALETRLSLLADGARWIGARGCLRDAGAACAAGEGWCCAGWLLQAAAGVLEKKTIFVN